MQHCPGKSCVALMSGVPALHFRCTPLAAKREGTYCMGNSYSSSFSAFQCRHQISNRWHQLDLILTKKKDLNHVHNTRSLHSADCETDYVQVRCPLLRLMHVTPLQDQVPPTYLCQPSLMSTQSIKRFSIL